MAPYVSEHDLSDDELDEAAEFGGFIRGEAVYTAWRHDRTGAMWFRHHDASGGDASDTPRTLADYDKPPMIHGVGEDVDVSAYDDDVDGDSFDDDDLGAGEEE